MNVFSSAFSLPLPQVASASVEASSSSLLINWSVANAEQTCPAAWRYAVSKNLSAIAELQSGWDGPGSEPVSRKLIYAASTLIGDALQAVEKAKAPYIVPRADGGVQIEWASLNYELEYRLRKNGLRSFWLCNRDTGEEIEQEGDGATELLYRWAKQVSAEPGDGGNVLSKAHETSISFAA